MFWKNFQNILLDENHLCFDICYKPCFLSISEVKSYHKVEVMLTTLERLRGHIGSFSEWHESMYFLIWVSLHSRQQSIPVIGISKKWFCILCNHFVIQKCINDVVIEFINILLETCALFYLAKLYNYFTLLDGHWYCCIYFHIGEYFADRSSYLACWKF